MLYLKRLCMVLLFYANFEAFKQTPVISQIKIIFQTAFLNAMIFRLNNKLREPAYKMVSKVNFLSF